MPLKVSQSLRYPASGVQVSLFPVVAEDLIALARQISCTDGHKHLLEIFKVHIGRANGESVTDSSGVSWAETDLENLSRRVATNGVNYLIGFCGACYELERSGNVVPTTMAIDSVLARHSAGLRITNEDLIVAGTHVPAPILGPTADEAMGAAISDAENMIQSGKPANAVDRLHTALHVYLREICAEANISVDSEASAPKLYREIRKAHPAFSQAGTRSEDIDRIVKSMASAIDALSTIRNKASLAHGRKLLDIPEAHLAVNATKTIVQYLRERATAVPITMPGPVLF